MEVTVRKNKGTRIAYRMLGVLFSLAGIGAFIAAFLIQRGIRVLLGLFGLIALYYGYYLVKMSFRKQAYDITYQFLEEGIRIMLHNGEVMLPYDEVLDVKLVIPDPDILYQVVQIKTKTEQYVLNFSGDEQRAKAVYEFVNRRVTYEG